MIAAPIVARPGIDRLASFFYIVRADWLTTFTSTSGVTTTSDYDTMECITRRYVAVGYYDYTYDGNNDWLMRMTWHDTTTGVTFDLVRY